MRFLLLLASLLLLAPEAWAAVFTSTGTGGDWTNEATWDVGSSYPQEGDDAIVSAGDTVTLNIPDLEVDSLQFAGADAIIECSSGATLTMQDWPTTATTDWFVSASQGVDTNSGATSTMGATGPEETWSAGIAHAAAGEHVLFMRGWTYFITGDASFTGGGTVGSYGLGDSVAYGPRPVWNLGATNTLTHSGASATTLYHTEISCGDVLTAELVMDRVTAVAPAAIEFQLDVNHTHLPSTEPRLSKLTDGTEIRGGPDFILPTTVWNFGDPGSGNWTTGARATSTTPWSKNMEMPMPVAFHVYERPGQYVVTSETSYGGETVTNTVTVTITSPEAEWDDADTFCFANSSATFEGCPHDTDNDGTCEDNVGNCIVTSDFDQAISTASTTGCNIDVDSVRCLFRRGDTFDADANTGIVQSDDWMIGAFGDPEAARPAVNTNAYSGNVITMGEAPNGRIMDIVMTGDGSATDSKPIYFDTSPSGQCAGVEYDNLLISRVDIHEFGNGFNWRGNTSTGNEQYRPECANDNIVMYESAVYDANFSTGGGVDLFMHGSSGAVLGGDYGNRDNHEHGMRAKRISNMHFAHLDLGRLGDASDNQGCGGSDDGAGRHLITIRNGPSGNWQADGDTEDELAKVYTQRFGLVDNHIGVCADNGLTVNVEATSNGDDHEFWHSYLVWGNLINMSQRSTAFGGAASVSVTMFTLSGSDVLVANNAFWMDCGITTGNCRAIELNNAKGSSGQTPDTASQRVHVYNNSFFAESTNSSTTQMVGIDSDHRDVTIVNNLMVDLESATFLSDNGENTTQCNDDGTACNPEETTNTAFDAAITGANPPSLDWFKLNATYADGTAVGVYPDSGWAGPDPYAACRPAVDGAREGLHEVDGTPCILIDNTAANTSNLTSAVGVNLQRNESFQSALPWANAMKMALDWKEDDTTCNFTDNGDYTGDFDDAGYPLDGVPGACVWTHVFPDDWDAHQWEGGSWTLLFDGTATPTFGGAISGSSGSGGNYTLTVDEGSAETEGLKIGFTAITSLDNMRLYPPGGVCAANATAPYGGFEPWSYCDDTGSQTLHEEDTCAGDYPSCVSIEDAAENGGLIFHPLFMKRMKSYRTIRMMDWARTNNIDEGNGGAVKTEYDWSPPGMYTYNYNARHITPRSVNAKGTTPPEVQVEFCDQLGAECWMNIPHLATDTEIERLGRLCRDNTDLECLFELGNETWNPIFEVHNEIWDLADAAYGSCSSRSNNACRDAWYGNRVGEMCDLLEAVFDETGEDSRMTCILATQGSSTTVTDNRIDCDCGSSCGTGAPTCDWTNLDGLAIALYFGRDGGDGDVGDCDSISPATVAGLARTGAVTGNAQPMAQYISDRITGGSDWVTAQSDELASQSLSSVAIYVYEGGTNYADTVSNSGLCLDAMTATCTPGTGDCIYDQYEDALDGYEAHNSVDGEEIRTFVTFNSHSPYSGAVDDNVLSSMGNRGSWVGGQSSWPKEDAILDWAAANPCWWTSCELGTAAAEAASPSIQGGTVSGGSISYRDLEQRIIWSLMEDSE